jgi:TonB family protein
VVDGSFPIPVLALPTFDGVDVDLAQASFDVRPLPGPGLAGTAGDGYPLDPSLVDQLPVLLAGPVPAYPELLRQAGVQGRVVLEAVVDTTGHIEPGSWVVVGSAHPGLVAPAQQALAATLFRPARVAGVAVRVRVRIAIDFVLRGGRGAER